MIVVELCGGLGNQLFQYAAARTVADRLGVDLGLDIRPLQAHDSRAYALDRFNIRASMVDRADLVGAHGPRSLKRELTTGLLERLWLLVTRPRFANAKQVVYQAPTYNPVLEQVTDHSWLCGYWQSERYFQSNADRLRQDLTWVNVSASTTATAEELSQMSYPVAVHVRRGDYAHVASTLAYHGLMDDTYYHAAFSRIRSRRDDAAFVFFSDEPEWVTDHFRADAARVIAGNAGRPEEDLYLMTRCRSHVIANSSFSWWGAWLAGSDEVIAPKSWYRAPHVDGRDVVPDRWTRL